MNLLKQAQLYVGSLDDNDKDEYYETAYKRAHDVLCSFLLDQGESLWKVTFCWTEPGSVQWTTEYFLDEQVANAYAKTEMERMKTTPRGVPSSVVVSFGGRQ